MSTQGQGDVVERLRAAAREIRNDGTASQVGLSEQECEDIADEITRLRALLSSSRGEQGWRLVPEKPTEAMNIAAVDAYRKTALFSSIWEACLAAAPSAPGSVPTSLAGQVPDEVLSTIGDWAKWAREWSGSAFIAGDPVENEAEARGDLYAGLCRLGNEMLWLGDELLKIAAPQPTAGGDAPTSQEAQPTTPLPGRGGRMREGG